MPATRPKRHSGDLTPVTLLCFAALLLLTAATALFWSHVKLFWTDELLEFYSDAKPSIAKIIADQYRAPFSLEPPLFHVLLHVLERVIPTDRLAARLPSMGCLLLTEISVFSVARRATRSQAAALVAMAVPFALVTMDFGPEARVYGPLTGCLAFALLCWQRCILAKNNRMAPLVGLGVALGLAMLMHFYGVFLAVPLWCGEITRTLERRRIDWPIFASLTLGSAALALDLPFLHGLGPFRQLYYSGESAWSNIAFTYLWFWDHFPIYRRGPAYLARGEWLATLVVLALVAASLLRAVRQWRSVQSCASLEVALSVTALLPVLNLVAAQFTKAYVPRYSLPAVAGIAVLLALFIARVPGDRWLSSLLIVCLTGFGLVKSEREIQRQKDFRNMNLGTMHLTPTEQQALQRNPDHRIYVQNVARLMLLHYYAPPALRAAITGVYSIPCDLRWTGRDPGSLFARNMGATAGVPFVPFASLHDSPGPHILSINHDQTEEWIEKELHDEAVKPEPLGPALWGDLYLVTFNPDRSCQTDAALPEAR